MDKSERESNLIDDKLLFDEVLPVRGVQSLDNSVKELADEYEAGVDYEMQLRFHNRKKDKNKF